MILHTLPTWVDLEPLGPDDIFDAPEQYHRIWDIFSQNLPSLTLKQRDFITNFGSSPEYAEFSKLNTIIQRKLVLIGRNEKLDEQYYAPPDYKSDIKGDSLYVSPMLVTIRPEEKDISEKKSHTAMIAVTVKSHMAAFGDNIRDKLQLEWPFDENLRRHFSLRRVSQGLRKSDGFRPSAGI